jgi:hypothetical protein
MVLLRISESFIEHVLKRHRDWIEMLKLKSMVEIENTWEKYWRLLMRSIEIESV